MLFRGLFIILMSMFAICRDSTTS
ncbi:unnamed protein product, partial [Rotaria magnacalcarata]